MKISHDKTIYDNFTREKLIAHIKKLEKNKKYGLVWDTEKIKETFEEHAQEKLPILEEVVENSVSNKTRKIVNKNFLIEGDNYHALSVLNYTHDKKFDVIYIDPPYNTGAKDWKYNNNFIDEHNTYRHSRWISMMNNRLKLAKNVLKQDGVLIITIDDHELFRILGLLELLGANVLGIVCICIKPEGRRQSKYVMESHEYAIFSTWGSPVSRGLDINFGLDFPDHDDTSKFKWEGLMRRDAGREDRGSVYWYPFYVSKNEKISMTRKKGYAEVFPINTKNVERVWLWDRDRSMKNLDQLKAKIRNNRITIYYKRRKSDRIKPTSFWHGSKYNANAYGTRLLDAIVPGNNFNFPKSVYAVLDCIDMFLPEDGIVLDFFAGSGTTGHAVLKLNHEYGGSRSFVLCTNNENNIATDTCLPRIRNVMNGYKHNQIEEKGLGGELIYYKTTFIDSIPSDENKKNMARKVTEMLCLKENCFDIVSKNKDFRIYRNQDHYLGIVYYYTGIKLCKIAIKKLNKPIDVYVFSLTDDVDYDDFKELGNTITLKPIPAAILNVYKRLFGYVRTKTVSRKTCETTGRKN